MDNRLMKTVVVSTIGRMNTKIVTMAFFEIASKLVSSFPIAPEFPFRFSGKFQKYNIPIAPRNRPRNATSD